MYAEYLVVDNHTQRQEVKHIRKIMPTVRAAVFSGAFGVEAIRLCDASGLVIAAD